MRFLIALPLAAIMAAGTTDAAAARSKPYRAAGTEPFWSLTIDRHVVQLSQLSGPRVTVRTPRAINGFAGEIYRTTRLSVNVVHSPCNDGMSDRLYRDTVTVTIRGATLHGCGGGEVTPNGDR